jgi:hypothetical protein
MTNLLADSKLFLVADLKYPLMTHFPGIVPKIHPVNKSIAIKCDRCINTGEPAAVFVFPRQIKVVEFILPETAAAGSLFHPSPITPLPHYPIFIKPLNIQKTRIKKSCVNHISRRNRHERS